MPVNFSTISQMDLTTVSKLPAFSTNTSAQKPPAAAPNDMSSQQPLASSRINNNYEPEPKKSHWFLKTLGAIIVIGGALVAARKSSASIKEIDLTKELSKEAKLADKAKFYTAKAGEWIIVKAKAAKEWVVGIFDKTKKDTKAK